MIDVTKSLDLFEPPTDCNLYKDFEKNEIAKSVVQARDALVLMLWVDPRHLALALTMLTRSVTYCPLFIEPGLIKPDNFVFILTKQDFPSLAQDYSDIFLSYKNISQLEKIVFVQERADKLRLFRHNPFFMRLEYGTDLEAEPGVTLEQLFPHVSMAGFKYNVTNQPFAYYTIADIDPDPK